MSNLNALLSSGTPVVLLATAAWCGPCKTLKPALEKDIGAMGGKVTLGILDIDKEQELATQMRVQSVPLVLAVHEGRTIDQFVGVPAPDQYQAFLAKLRDLVGPDQAVDEDTELRDAFDMVASGDVQQAAATFNAVYKKHSSDDDILGAKALAGLVRCVLADDAADQADGLVATLREKFRACLGDPDIAKSLNQYDLRKGGTADGEDLESLLKIVEEEPENLDTRFRLATLYVLQENYEDAIKQCLYILRKDKYWEDVKARDLLFKCFDSLGPSHPVTLSSRQRFAN